MGKVRVAIVGVGNCASSLVQGVHYYRAAKPDDVIPGLMHVTMGGYHVSDLEFSAAFDVDPAKIGKDLGEAIYVEPNNTYRFAAVPKLGVAVSQGRTHDSIGFSGTAGGPGGASSEVAQILRETRTDVVVSYLPIGSEQATKWYVEQVLTAGCALVNCVPVSIAREAYWQHRFQEASLPLIGDDIKSQVNAMAVHRVLTRLFRYQGMRLDRTSQLNLAGNADLSEVLDWSRPGRPSASSARPETADLDYPFTEDDAYIGPSAHVPWLEDRRWSYIHLQGRTFGDVPFTVELKVESWESPSSGGLAIDAVRCAKIALDRGIGGVLDGPSSLFMTGAPQQHGDDEARRLVESFLAGTSP